MSWYDEPRTIRAQHWLPGLKLVVHEFTIPGMGMKGGYVTGISLDAFRNRMCAHFSKTNDHEHLYHVRYEHDWEMDRATDERLRVRFPDLPTMLDGAEWHHHESLWDFYKAIGYDYKKKRWADGTRT